MFRLGLRNILIVTKQNDEKVVAAKEQLMQWLHKNTRAKLFTDDHQQEEMDLVIGLGGDGTLLRVSSMFPKQVPPVLCFSMGTMGFLMPFNFADHETILKDLIEKKEGNILWRSRLALQLSNKKYTAMNEVLIQRSNCSMLSLQLFSYKDTPADIDSSIITKADGLLLSTPTGSTGYSLSAGGPIIHPQVTKGILMTPICPLSLSFRPLLLPEHAKLGVRLDPKSRCCEAEIIVDGHSIGKLSKEEESYLHVEPSPFSVPVIVEKEEVRDPIRWLEDVHKLLHWNQIYKPRMQ